MNAPDRTQPQPAATSADETGSLARELGRVYQSLATFYRDELALSPADADRRARGADMTPEEIAADRDRLAAAPVDQVSWFDLNRLANRDPADALAVWDRLKAEARRELDSGHRAAQALAWDGRPWDRAQFLAIRESFRDSEAPADSIEAALLDVAAQSFTAYLDATHTEQMLTCTEAERQEAQLARSGHWRPSHITTADAINQAAARAEQAHRRLLRTLGALDARRRRTPASIGGPLDVQWRVRCDEPITGTDIIDVSDKRSASDAA